MCRPCLRHGVVGATMHAETDPVQRLLRKGCGWGFCGGLGARGLNPNHSCLAQLEVGGYKNRKQPWLCCRTSLEVQGNGKKSGRSCGDIRSRHHHLHSLLLLAAFNGVDRVGIALIANTETKSSFDLRCARSPKPYTWRFMGSYK